VRCRSIRRSTSAFVKLERAEPKLYTSNVAKAARKDKIFID
jgi:DNA primase